MPFWDCTVLVQDRPCLELILVSSSFLVSLLLQDKILESVWKVLTPVSKLEKLLDLPFQNQLGNDFGADSTMYSHCVGCWCKHSSAQHIDFSQSHFSLIIAPFTKMGAPKRSLGILWNGILCGKSPQKPWIFRNLPPHPDFPIWGPHCQGSWGKMKLIGCCFAHIPKVTTTR